MSSATDTRLTLREKAIVTLALHTGLRGCDIANLRACNIDWEHEEIRLVQKKTGQPLILPFPSSVGNALLEYIMNERDPGDESEYVFPNKVQPGKRLSYKSISTIATCVFDKLGLRIGESHRGIGVFRHNLATRLLGAGTESGVVSGILGHQCPEAVESYVDSDIPHLRELGLSISDYPIPENLYT
ncbi:MAG: tyrosine-type recombinase/integrase [Muribaculum sp.]|nr:tyrosine-type recombinase/integrase [Muribaculum sp.]